MGWLLQVLLFQDGSDRSDFTRNSAGTGLVGLTIVQSGGDTVISPISSSDEIRLVGITSTDIGLSDFDF